jgi:hypothetical protein
MLLEEHPQEELCSATKCRRQAHPIPRHAHYPLRDPN